MKSRTNKLHGLQLAVWLLVTVLFLVPIALLAFHLPGVAVLIFVPLLCSAAVLQARLKGFWSGVRLFFKEIIWGW